MLRVQEDKLEKTGKVVKKILRKAMWIKGRDLVKATLLIGSFYLAMENMNSFLQEENDVSDSDYYLQV